MKKITRIGHERRTRAIRVTILQHEAILFGHSTPLHSNSNSLSHALRFRSRCLGALERAMQCLRTDVGELCAFHCQRSANGSAIERARAKVDEREKD